MEQPADEFFSAANDRPAESLPLRHRLFNRYLIGNILGHPGGFGITYLGWDATLRLQVAIKEFLPRRLVARASDGVAVESRGVGSEGKFGLAVGRFLTEARVLASLRHPNVVKVLNFFEENGTAYLVMEYHRGASLAQYVHRVGGRLPWPTALQTLVAVLHGLEATHAKDVLHCDIKPPNIYLTDDGEILLLDYGAARVAVGDSVGQRAFSLTHGYAAAEMYCEIGGPVGPWSDVYACGATLYELLGGRQPMAALRRWRGQQLEPLAQLQPSLPEPLVEVVEQAMALEPSRRIASAQGLAEALEQVRAALPRTDAESADIAPAGFSTATTVASDSWGARTDTVGQETGLVASAEDLGSLARRGSWVILLALGFAFAVALGSWWVPTMVPTLRNPGPKPDLSVGLGWQAADEVAGRGPQAELIRPVPVGEPELADEVLGRVIVEAVPWGRVMELGDASGQVQLLPDGCETPCQFELPVGSYRAVVLASGGGGRRRIELQVVAEQLALVRVEFPSRDPLEYFRSTGW